MKNIQHTSQTLVELLRWRSENQPEKLAYTFLADGEREAGSLTYKELDTRAKSIAAKLQSLGLAGERALLIYNSDLEYISAFFGCLYAGVISVPLHPPGKNKSLSRISSIAEDSNAKVTLSINEIQTELEKDFTKDDFLKNVHWIDSDEISNELSEDWKQPEISPETLAYLQYTSGSTGVPKGVMVNHKNLLHNLAIIDKSHTHNDESVMVTWLPIFHDMGLIYGILLPFFGGYPCYFMTPQAFVQKPFRWLRAISKYKGTHNAAPNFAFELCVNKITEEQKKELDLSTWSVAMNAAEPVRAETIERFVDYFKDCGFKLKYFAPGYGLAEGTLILSTTFKDDEPSMKRFDDTELEKNNKAVEAKKSDDNSKVHVGHSNSIEDTRIAIVNPVTHIECKEGEVGEVWSSGISIAQGYWKREDATNETFKAYIADTNEGPFMRTGDLGFIKDDELYITGRYKDLIIIRGQNHYPQDIEYTVESSHPAFRLGCVGAFSVDVNGEEQLGVVQEIQKNFVNEFDSEEVVRSIRSAVSLEHDLQVHSITLIQPGSVPKTSSGKIQRKACRQGFLEGTLEIIAEWKQGEIEDLRLKINKIDKFLKKSEGNTKEEKKKFIQTEINIREWLVNKISEMMQIRKEFVNVKDPFSVYGMDSLKAVELSGDLETLLNKDLPSTLVYDYPTIELLARHLNYDGNDKSDSYENKTKDKLKTSSGVTEIEDVAIIGIGLRFPGANNASEFWNNLIQGEDSIRQIPEDRWNRNFLNSSTITYGGFVNDVDKFDPVFFGISPREAVQIDPQQRFTLEVTWEALEDAGINPETLAGKNVGVFMGICTYDYARFTAGRKDLFDVYTGTGTSLSIAANRISYAYDFRGPSIAIDTACSSSLVALHTACQSLNSGQSGLALAGGVNLLLAPDWNVVFTEADMLATDGRCKTFDADADGYVRSEGCGIVVLKKLSDAVRDGDRIYSVIKGSALNQDGKSNGLTAPNGPSQEEVIKSALINSNVKANEINYLETHGTGTPLGDPIEVNSLSNVLTKDRSEENILYIGSVKTNIGHLEAAAGIAGVIKTSLALYNKEIPRHLNYKKINPEIQIGNKPVKVAEKNIKWNGRNRLAGISSFGFGGTNAHVILGEAPELRSINTSRSKPFNMLTLSAKNETSLKELADSYIDFLNENPEAKPEDICYTSNTGRASHNHRLAIVCSTAENLNKQILNFKAGKQSAGIVTGVVKINHHPKVAFLFPGQGAQFIGMGKELYDSQPYFRSIINKCDEILRSHLDKALLEVLFYEKDENLNPINETTYTQPVLFAIEYALAKLWMSWGINPDVMMGHSAGEYVAACVAGVFSLEDGLKLVTERGRLMQTLTGDGEMYTIFTDEETAKKAINGFEDSVSIASINGPLKTVISGDKNSMAKIIPEFDKKQIEYKKINVSIASHSPLMNTMIEEFRKVCNTVKYSVPAIPVVSNITGEIVTDRISNPDYWCEHILSAVRFSDGIKACVNYGCEFFIDLGPKPTSISMGQETISKPDIHWLPSIKFNFTIWETMLQSLGTLYVNGLKPDWNGFDKDFSHKIISLPNYPFQKQRYWIEDLIKAKSILTDFSAGDNSGLNPLLGKKIISASKNEFIFNTIISGSNTDYLKDHIVFDKIVLPGAAYVEIALGATDELLNQTAACVSDMIFHQALVIESDESINIQTIFTKKENNKFSFRIFSLDKTDKNSDNLKWTLHASGFLSNEKNEIAPAVKLTELKKDFKEIISADDFYNRVDQIGINYKKNFRGIKELFINGNSALAGIEPDEKLFTDNYNIHPALLDASFQSALSLLLDDNADCAFIPVGIEKIFFSKKAAGKLWSLAEIKNPGDSKSKVFKADITIFSSEGELIASVIDLQLRKVSREEFISAADEIKNWFYEIAWERQNLPVASDSFVTVASDIRNYADSKLSATILKNDLTGYKNGIDELNKICISYIVSSFIKAGLIFSKGRSYEINILSKNLSITDKYSKLFLRLLRILEENGIIRIAESKIEVISDNESGSQDDKLKSLLKSNPELESEITLVSRCGPRLTEVLSGKTEALQLLFPDGDFSAATRLYQDSPGFAAMNESVKFSLENIIENFPADKKLKILEIGAGTGSTTSYVLPLLKDLNAQYTFTDISAAFFNKAKEKFGSHQNVSYKVLDIEAEPVKQNFNDESFDIIIASNVIHATRDLGETIVNIRKLLAPDGILILNEVTEKQNWIDLTFGLTDGWWRFEDNALRKDHPLLMDAEWEQFLKAAGFETVEVFSPYGNEDESSYTGQSTIIAVNGISEQSNQSDLNDNSHFIIFTEKKNRKQLEEYLKKEEQSYTLVTEADSFKKISDTEFEVNYSVKDNHEKLFNDISSKVCDEIKIISFHSGKKISDKISNEVLQHSGCILILNIIQAISKAKFSKSPQLFIVTENARAVNDRDEVSGLISSPLWGMGKVISLEHPELKCKLIDIDSETGPGYWFKEFNGSTDEDQIAFRNNERYAARLIRSNSRQDKIIPIDDKSTYLITGGLGGLGVLTAKWLADKGARHLALVSRSNNTDSVRHHLDELRSMKAEVRTYKADVTNRDELKNILEDIRKSGYLLKGIIHSAGVLDDGVILNQSPEKFERVTGPKVTGAMNLHELTKKDKIDFFVLYSSVASVLGSAGQANHSAANAFLDSLAHYRRHRDLPALSINWGVWSEIGSAAAKGADSQEKIAGIKSINPKQGMSALEKAMMTDTAQIGVMIMDWIKYSGSNRQQFISGLITETKEQKTEDQISTNNEYDFITELQNSPDDKHTDILIDYFKDLISRIMGMEPEDLEAEIPLNMMGLDSLMAIELKNKVNAELGVDLNLVRYMEETNIINLADELKLQVPKILSSSKAKTFDYNTTPEISEEEKTQILLGNLDNLSEEELDKLLNETK